MLCQSGKPSCYQRNFLHITFEGNSQLLKSYTITGSRCSHCWSVEWIKDLQKPVEAYFSCLFIAPMCRYLSSPTFLTPFHVFFFIEVLLCSRPMFTTPLAILYTKANQEDMKRTEILMLLHGFSPSHYPPTQWDYSGRSEWHFQTKNLKLHFNTQLLSCHRNNTTRLIWVLTNSHLFC